MKQRKPKAGESLKIGTVVFQFRGKGGVIVNVRFHHHKGKPSIASVHWYEEETAAMTGEHQVDNRKGRYKPCMTHAKELLALATQQPAKTEFAKQRRKEAAPPALKIHG